MDLRFLDAIPTGSERAAIDGVLGPPSSTWEGADDRADEDVRVAIGGRTAAKRRHMLLPALHAVQSEIGWISEGALNHVCMRLAVPPAEAYGVASFYSLLALEERPPMVAHVCDDIGCAGFGAEEVIAHLEGAIGPAGEPRNGVMWLRSPCLGQCDRAPAVYVQRAGSSDTTVTGSEGPAVLASLGDGRVDETLPSIPQVGDPSLRLLRRIGTVDPESIRDYRSSGGYTALARSLELGPIGVIDEVKASGLRGRGGAAFPTGVKWEAVAAAREDERYLINNADESEPGTFKDRVLMEGDPFAVVESMTIAGLSIGARRGYLYIRGEYPLAEARMANAIAAATDAGLLGASILGSNLEFDIEIRRGAGAYICGEETALMNSIEGFRGEPRNKPPFPTEVGLFGKPTVINNVETLMNVIDIVCNGGQEFAAVGTSESTGPKLFCLSGAVAGPGVYEVPFGTTLGEVLDLAGGMRDGGSLRAVLLGGAAGSFVGPDALDMPLTFEGARERGAALGSGVVVAFDEQTDFASTLRRIAAFFRDESCGQCVPCRVGTVRQEELLARHLVSGMPLDAPLLGEISAVMRDASICGLGQTASGAIETAIDLGLLEATS